MKKVHSVKLEFFEDENTGEWGLSHPNSIRCATPFNAFFTGIGIFHDVLEHWFEDKHKYFLGRNSFNVGGEMAAMGAMWYYFETLGVSNRLNYSSFYTPQDNTRATTENMIQEAIEYDYIQYGDTLESGVPHQKPTENSELEYIISKMWGNVKKMNPGIHSEDNKESAIAYKKSVTHRKIADLHRWGYRMAERLVPENYHNSNELYSFLEYLNEFTKNHDAEELSRFCNYMQVDIYKHRGEISIKVKLLFEMGLVKDSLTIYDSVRNVEITRYLMDEIYSLEIENY